MPNGSWAWQSSYIDAFDHEAMLNWNIWKLLRFHYTQDGGLWKYYNTYEDAMEDYQYAFNAS